MKKYFIFLCGLFFAANTVVATAGCHSSIAPEQDSPGLAIDIDYHKIVSGCGSRITTVPDIENKKDIIHIPNREECDGDSFDTEMELILCTGGNTLNIVQESSTTNIKVAGTVTPQQDNRARGP